MRLLIVGSLNGHMNEAAKIAFAKGAKLTHADSVEQALAGLRNGKGADLVMVDAALDIAYLVTRLESERITLSVVACGLGNDTEGAVRAIRAGAKEYVPLPPDADMIAAIFEAVSSESQDVIGRDPAMRQVLDMAQQIAPSEATVLITGESGTGKEVISRFIHRKSKRSAQPFVSINCAAIPEHLLESELFGHEKGAFTGAVARRVGKFEEANGGTLLLDEISEIHPALQAKLLRAIQEREIDRVGGTQPVKVNIRLLATSNRNLEDAVRAGSFREDLYFRLNVVNIRMPSLRERPADIPLLAEFFARKYADANGLSAKRVSVGAIDRLMSHHWRGNVRELENTLHRAVLLSRADEIEPEAIMLSGQSLAPDPAPAAPSMMPMTTGYRPAAQAAPMGDAGGTLVGRTVAEVERDLIIDTLKHCLGNRTHAANILGISIRTLRNKLRQYNAEGVSVPMPGGELDQARV